MSTIMYQGCNSYLESRFNDNRTLWLKLSSPKPNNNLSKSVSQDFDKKYQHKQDSSSPAPNLFFGCKTSQSPSFDTPSYVHPSVKKSMFALSDQSLAMCTENLGNESGTDVFGFNEADIPSSSSSSTFEVKKIRPLRSLRKTTTQFPPPLTTRRQGGPESVHIVPVREDGKLILQAVKAPTSTCLRAERSNGCLRLFMLKGQNDHEVEDEEEVKNSTTNNNGTKLDEGRKFQRPNYNMCKEVGCRKKEEILLNLESFWVAT